MAASSSRSIEADYATLSLSVEDEEELVITANDIKDSEEDNKFLLVGDLPLPSISNFTL